MNQSYREPTKYDGVLLFTVGVMVVLCLVVSVWGGRWRDQAKSRGKQIDFIQQHCKGQPDGTATCPKGTFTVDLRVNR